MVSSVLFAPCVRFCHAVELEGWIAGRLSVAASDEFNDTCCKTTSREQFTSFCVVLWELEARRLFEEFGMSLALDKSIISIS